MTPAHRRSRPTQWRFICLLLGLVARAASGDAETTQRWQYEHYGDPLHKGGVITVAQQVSTAKSGESVTTLVRCWSATGELDVRMVVSGAGRTSTDEVRWQFDRGASRTARWRTAQNPIALIVPDTIKREFVEKLQSSRTLTISTLPGGSSYSVPLNGSSRAIASALQLCRR